MNLKGKVGLVTGASQGIGFGCATEMAKAGADVVINHLDSEEAGEKAAAEIRKLGVRCLAMRGDVSDQAAMEGIIDRTIKEMGRLDLFVANAVFSEREPMLTANVALFKKTVDVNFWGTFYGVRYVSQKFVEHKTAGSIVVISSPHAVIAMPNAMAYNAAKAAIDQMARTAALELAEHKIRVNIVHPGWTDTPGERKFYTDEQLEKAGKTIPLGRLGKINDIGRAVTFLLSDDAEYMTGSTMLVDGGITLPVWAFKRV